MKFGDSNYQNVKMPDWIWSSGPDLAPLSRNRVKLLSQNTCILKLSNTMEMIFPVAKN